MRARVVVACVALACGAPAAAQYSSLDSVLPRGAQRGTEINVVLRGKQLADARALLFEPGGIEVLELRNRNAGRVDARLALAPDAALGPRAIWLRTATGLTNLRTFHVGALREEQELEPNGSVLDAQWIVPECTLNGVAENEDVDFYAFVGRADEPISIEIEGQRLGDRLFDPALALLDDAGFALASCDDSAVGRQDPVLAVVLPADGRYLVRVRESAYRGAGNCRYRLHVRRFHPPVTTLPLGGRRGEELTLRLIEADGDVRDATLRLPEARARGGWVPAGVASVPVAAQRDMASAWLRVVDLDNALELEPNDDLAGATPFEAPAALNGVLERAGDVDRYVFSAKKGESFELAVFARRLRTPVDSVLAVQQPDGKTLVANDDDGGPDSRLSFKAPHDGEFIVTLRDQLMRGGPEFAYRIELAAPRPGVSVSIPSERKQFAVPRFGRTAFNLAVEREAFGGPVALQLRGLPPFVRATIPLIPPGVDQVPVLLEALPDAEPSHALCEVGARGVSAGLREDVELVLGRNRVVFWAHTIDRLPVAVNAERAPISVRLELPDVPLVRGGYVRVEAVVERAQGFEGAITVSLPFLPPGVNAVRQRQIGADAERARFDLSAAGGRAARWVAAARDGRGRHPGRARRGRVDVRGHRSRGAFPALRRAADRSRARCRRRDVRRGRALARMPR